MGAWTPAQLDKLGSAEELQIAPAGPDGSLRPYTTVWGVRVGHDVFVRSYRGASGRWYQEALQTGKGRVRADGVEHEIEFDQSPAVDPTEVDQAYRSKYGPSTYVTQLAGPDIAATTLRLVAV